MSKEFKIPELGEGVESASVAKVLVSEGDVVEVDQAVVELETDKAAAEVPCDIAGTVEKVHVKEGDEVEVGQTVLTLSGADSEEENTGKDDTTDGKQDDTEEEPGTSSEEEKPPAEQEEQKKEKGDEDRTAPENVDKPRENGHQKTQPEETGKDADKKEKAEPETSGQPEQEPAPAAPSVRRFAREIGVDIDAVEGSGPSGRISIEDVKQHSRSAGPAGKGSTLSRALPDFSQWGDVTREEMSKVRRLTAERMSHAWNTVPQVTQFDRADITKLDELRRDYQEQIGQNGTNLTLTAVLVKVLGKALRAFPRVNASVDMEEREVVLKNYVNVGVAADTERGLVVPVLKHVDRKSTVELSNELNDLVDKARQGRLEVSDMRGGNMTLSNAGVLGGGAFTPIVNWPESAILGVGRARTEAVFVDGMFRPRQMLPLALSYDHRVIDGADAVRFLRWVVQALQDPMKLVWEA